MTEHVLEHLSAYLDGELAAAEQERFRAHLAQCASCARRLEELAAVDRSLRELPTGAPERYFDELPARLRGRLSAAAPMPRRLRTLPVWALAAAATLLVGVLAPLTLLDRPSLAPAPAAKSAAEIDSLARSQTASAAPAATIPAAPRPLATSAPAAREEFQRADSKARRVEQPKREALAARVEDSGAPPPAAPPAQAGGVVGGFAPPPRAAEPQPQQSGPRANQQQIESDKQQQSRQAPAAAQAAAPAAVAESAVRSRDLEKKDADAAPATEERTFAKEAATVKLGRAAAKAALAPAASYRELQGRSAPRSAEEARALRDSWRTLAAEVRDAAQADEARVKVIELGLEAWRLGRSESDRQRARIDGAAYLKSNGARQTERVRAALETLNQR